jgi:chromosomal replication initiator protein
VEGFSDALRSRLAWGVQADLRKPAFATRLAILRSKASQQAPAQQAALADGVLEQIAQRCCPTVRELEGYLNRVVMHLPLLGDDVTPDAIERALAVFDGPAAPPPPPSADEIVAAVCARTGATPGDLRGRSRNRQVTYARHLAMYILRHDANKSVAEIQRLFGNRDHSTVLGAIARIEGERTMEPATAADLSAVRDAIAGARVVVASPAAPAMPQSAISQASHDR